jgi:hypothetical protein
MPSEMLSGPDLGAGYLHQLTTDRDGDRTTFTFHAQDGGQDANGPPKGPLDVFGFVHPPSPCPFGGPRCWHRRFLLPFTETARVRPCYNRGRFVLQAMIDQVYDGAAVAIGPALDEVAGRFATAGISAHEWRVGGSAGAWLLGAPVAPRDVDLAVRRAAVDRVGAALTEYLIEPTATTDWPGVGIVRGARAFVGTFVTGARVEWAVPLDPQAPRSEWDLELSGTGRVPVERNGRTFEVARPEAWLVRAAGRHRREVPEFAAWLRGYGTDHALLETLIARERLDPTAADRLRSAVRP